MKKVLFKIFALALVFSLVLGLSSCGEDREAKGELSAMFAMLSEGKYDEAMKKYVAENDSGYDFLKTNGNFNEENFAAYKIHDALFKSLEYDIESSEVVNESEIHFKTKITTLDLSPVGKELAESAAAYNAAAENAEADEKLSDSELNTILSQQMVNVSDEYLSGKDVKKRSRDVEIAMYYDPVGKWFVHVDENLIEALCGGVYSAYYEALEAADMVKK